MEKKSQISSRFFVCRWSSQYVHSLSKFYSDRILVCRGSPIERTEPTVCLVAFAFETIVCIYFNGS